MDHPIHEVHAFKQTGPHELWIQFEDGSSRTIDFAAILTGELYGPLADPDFFAKVQLDPEFRTLIWPNGADFDPATLHDWPEHEAAFRAAAQRWAKSAEPMVLRDEPSSR
jgi:hypothetical protein